MLWITTINVDVDVPRITTINVDVDVPRITTINVDVHAMAEEPSDVSADETNHHKSPSRARKSGKGDHVLEEVAYYDDKIVQLDSGDDDKIRKRHQRINDEFLLAEKRCPPELGKLITLLKSSYSTHASILIIIYFMHIFNKQISIDCM